MREISITELVTMIMSYQEHAILDLRREGDFAKGHLFFATNIPRSLLELRLETLVPCKTTCIILIELGAPKSDVKYIFDQFGYTDVRFVSNGSRAWQEAGYHLYEGMNVPSKAFGEFIEETAGTPHIAPEDLHHLIQEDSNLVLIDARPFDEYQVMSIHGSVNCPGAELVYRIGSLNLRADQKIVVNCAGRTRSIIGAQTLIDSGLKNPVFALRDGTMGWHLAGLSLEHMKEKRLPPSAPAQLDMAREQVRKRAMRTGVSFIDAETCTEFSRDTNRTTYFFDIRDPEDFKRGHRKGFASAPGGQLVQTFDTFAATRHARHVLCDSDGLRAPMVGAWLRQMGIDDVFCLVDSDMSSHEPASSPLADHLIHQAPLVTPTELIELHKQGYAVYDLSSSKIYRRIHIEFALFAERETLLNGALAHNKAVLVSPDGRLAQIVARELCLTGSDVYALEGGLQSWRQAGFATVSGAGNLPAFPDDVLYKPYDLTDAAEDSMRAYLDWEKGLMERVVKEPGAAFRRL